MSVKVAGKVEHFTAIEYELRLFLVSSPGRLFTREQLMTGVWGYHHAGVDHTLTKHLSRIRCKIEKDPARQKYLKTVPGVGYRFATLDELQRSPPYRLPAATFTFVTAGEYGE